MVLDRSMVMRLAHYGSGLHSDMEVYDALERRFSGATCQRYLFEAKRAWRSPDVDA